MLVSLGICMYMYYHEDTLDSLALKSAEEDAVNCAAMSARNRESG